MRKFNKSFQPNKTRVLICGEWYVVKSVHELRIWIEVYGLVGSFQRGHVSRFTNKGVAA